MLTCPFPLSAQRILNQKRAKGKNKAFSVNVTTFRRPLGHATVQEIISVYYLLTYLLTPCNRILLVKLTGFAANQEVPRILWNP